MEIFKEKPKRESYQTLPRYVKALEQYCADLEQLLEAGRQIALERSEYS